VAGDAVTDTWKLVVQCDASGLGTGSPKYTVWLWHPQEGTVERAGVHELTDARPAKEDELANGDTVKLIVSRLQAALRGRQRGHPFGEPAGKHRQRSADDDLDFQPDEDRSGPVLPRDSANSPLTRSQAARGSTPTTASKKRKRDEQAEESTARKRLKMLEKENAHLRALAASQKVTGPQPCELVCSCFLQERDVMEVDKAAPSNKQQVPTSGSPRLAELLADRLRVLCRLAGRPSRVPYTILEPRLITTLCWRC